MKTSQVMPLPANRTAYQSLVLACVCGCTLLVIGLVAAINLAVPMLAASELHPSSSQVLWIVDIYIIVFACLVIPGGAVGDKFGRKGALLTGLVTFALGTAISAAAPTVPIMLFGRAVTGLGAALVLPNCVGVLIHATAPEHRKRALATWGAVSGMGGIVGNIVGAALLTIGSWRSLFAIVVPLALALVLWVALVVPRSSRSSRSLDPIGTILFIAATVSLLFGIIEGPEQGWNSLLVIAAFVFSVVLSVAWVVVEFRSAHPLLDPRLFRIPLLSSASLGMLVTFFGSFGLFYLNASLLQYGRGFSVLQAGLGVLPVAMPILLGSRFVPTLVGRIGFTLTLLAAFLAISIGLFGLSFTTAQPYLVYAAWLAVIGIGFTLALPSLTAELTAALPAEQAGVAGGLQSATRELGSALGVAIVGTVLTASFTQHLPASLYNHNPIPRTVAQALTIAPAQHNAIIAAFTTGANDALRIASLVTLITGCVVIAGVTWANRRSLKKDAVSYSTKLGS